ncbi:MAG: TonB-dependent receptor plug domain-containing protein [Pseudohongiella sp.]|nr:TonB-dependent receptor plug domain-containing protein [Pseudohongiella sp.]
MKNLNTPVVPGVVGTRFNGSTHSFALNSAKGLSRLSAIGLLTLYAASGLAQTSDGQTPGRQAAGTQNSSAAPALQEVLITERSIESTLPLELSRFGVDLEIVTEEQVRNHGFVDVAQSLEMLVPGVHLTTQAGAFSYINVQMQGSRNSDLLWALDGVRINNRLYNSTSPADTLPSSMIERLEILKGSHGLMYGTQAIAGVVNVVTRGFSSTPDGSVTLGAGSNGQRRANGYVRGSLGDHKVVAWASKDQTDGYELYDNYQPTAINKKRGYDVDSIGLKYGYDFSETLSFSATGIQTNARLDYPNVSNVSVNDREESILSAKFDYIPSDTAQFILKGYYHSWDTDYYTPPNPSAYWGYKDKGLTAATVLKPHRFFEYHLGYDYQTYEGQDEVLVIAGLREEVHAVYTQIRSSDDLSERARFAAGVRYNETGGNDSTVWNASGVYELTDSLYVQGMVATSFMLPSAENLYRIHCPTGQNCTHGNPNLAPEESFAVNLSVGGLLDAADRQFNWQLTGWDRKVDNLITTDAIPAGQIGQFPDGFTRTFINVSDEVTVRGGELLFSGPVSDAVSFNLSYTYSKEEARGTNQQISDRPRRQYKGSLSYASQTLPLGANLAVKYVGRKSSNVTGFGTQYYGDAYVVDAGAHAYLDAAEKHRVTLRVENLLDETVATAVNSAVLVGSNPQERFLWQRLAVPRSLYVNYQYSF